MVLDSAKNIGVLKDLTKYGATFMPLDLNMEQKEKAVRFLPVPTTACRALRHP